MLSLNPDSYIGVREKRFCKGIIRQERKVPAQWGRQMSVREEQKEPSETAFISRVSLRILNALLNHWFLTAICHKERIITFRYKAKFTTGLEYRGWFLKSDYSHLLFVSEMAKIDGMLSNVANMESPLLIRIQWDCAGTP